MPVKIETEEEIDTHKGEVYGKMEADTRVMWPQAKGCQCYKNLEERDKERYSPRTSGWRATVPAL